MSFLTGRSEASGDCVGYEWMKVNHAVLCYGWGEADGVKVGVTSTGCCRIRGGSLGASRADFG